MSKVTAFLITVYRKHTNSVWNF